MIVVTGAAGFISSCLVQGLLDAGYKDLVLVDDFSKKEKEQNHINKPVKLRIEREIFPAWLEENPLVYASSAATYGLGENGYLDSHEIIPSLEPLNPYGVSKNEFDKWVLTQDKFPPFWAGLKFFNVYGPNEFHKGRMASVIFHAYNQIQKNGEVKLFRSHRDDYEDGKQLRDFIYLKDLVNVCIFLLENREHSGIYNLGTGASRSFLDLAKAVFKALSLEENISFIDTPEDIRDKYQYFTEAKMGKLRDAGYEAPFTSLEDGVEDYVKNYLVGSKVY